MKKIIALSLSLLMVLMCIFACDTTEGGENSSVAESSSTSNGEASIDELNADSSDVSDTSSETSQLDVEDLNIIYYKFSIPMFESNIPEKGATCVDNNGTGIDEYLFERNDASDDIYFAVGLRVSKDVTLGELTQMGFINEPKAVKGISWKVGSLGDVSTLPLDYIGYINPSTYDVLCKNEAFGVEIIWLNTSVIKYGSAVVCDVDSLENILYYDGEYSAAVDLYVNISGVREIYCSGIEKYLSENSVAEDVYFAVGISMAGAPEDSIYVNVDADELPHIFGFIKDPDAKLSLEIIVDYDYEPFVVPFDVVGYVNKTTFEKMQANTEFGIEITWLNEEYFQ